MDDARKRGIELAKGAIIPVPVFILVGCVGWDLLGRGTTGSRVAVFALCLGAIVALIGLGALLWRKRRWRAYGLIGSFLFCIAVVGALTAALASALTTVLGG